MALANIWLLYGAIAVLLIAIGVGVFLGLRAGRRGDSGAFAPVARAERVRALPTFRRAVRRRTVALSGILAVGSVALLASGVVAARPMAAQTIEPVNSSRDIMLCLDVSGSMVDVDAEVLTVFLELLDGFEGERIGLTIFNSSAVQVFPLTDDYPFIRENLERIQESFTYYEEMPEHWVGTLNGQGSSLVGDGLAACVMRFDNVEEDRSRSIIFATDNEALGASIVTLEEAAEFARSSAVRVFSINPIQDDNSEISAELVRAVQITGGNAYALRSTTTVDDIVEQVQKEEATALKGEAQVIWTDRPDLWVAISLVLTLGFIVVLWRVKL